MSEAQAIAGVPDGRARLPLPPAGPPLCAHGSRVGVSSLLMLDPDLAEGLLPGVAASLHERMLVQVAPFGAGSWSPHPRLQKVSALLVIDGLLVREVQVAGRTSAELFGAGDIIHPPGEEDPSAAPAGQWKAIVPGHLALLDDRLLRSATQSFPLLSGLLGRATRRGRILGALALTRTMRRTDDRLLFLLTFLAARWGRIRPDGVRLSLPISHELLARLIGTRRQAVTTALGDLRTRGLIEILPNGDWLLSKHPSLSEPSTLPLVEASPSDGVRAGQVNLLNADSRLAGVLSTGQLAQAASQTQVRTRLLSPGGWDPPAASAGACNWLGLLVLDGFLSLESSYLGESALEIVGPGDLLRPWDEELEYPLAAITSRWRVLRAATVALLDDEFATRIAPWPALTSEILARAGRRARWLTARLAICQQIHVRDRILYLFSCLARRWGTTDAGGAIIPIPVTHEQIAKLVGAQRPSVTIAVGELSGEGLLTRLSDRTWRIPSHGS